jgi:hypothetical protein
MTVPSTHPGAPTALDVRVAEAHETAKAVAEAWAKAPLNRQAQAAALAYLIEHAPGDQALYDFWGAEPRLAERVAQIAPQTAPGAAKGGAL